MSNYVNYYHEHLENGHEEQIVFNALVCSIADVGSMSDLRALCDERERIKKATAPTQ